MKVKQSNVQRIYLVDLMYCGFVDLWFSWICGFVDLWICGFRGFVDFVDFSVLTSDSNNYCLWNYVLFDSPTVIMVEPILNRTVILLISFSEIENLDSTEMHVH